MVPSQGIEPWFALYQSAVLPLNDSGNSKMVPTATLRTRIFPLTRRKLYHLSYVGRNGADRANRTHYPPLTKGPLYQNELGRHEN